MTGTGTPSAIVPKEEQAGVDMIPHGDNPADGRDLGAAENMIDTARAGKAQVAWNDQHKGFGKGQQRQRHPRDQPRDCDAGPRHQQQPQDQRGKRRRPPLPWRTPPQTAPEQLGAGASTGDVARAEEVQASPERASQGLGKTQTAAQRKQERSRPRRAPRVAPEQQGASADPGNEAGTEEREGPVLSDLGQRAPQMEDIKKKVAAFLERENIQGGQRSRMKAGIYQILEVHESAGT
jgi:hypothetical protein